MARVIFKNPSEESIGDGDFLTDADENIYFVFKTRDDSFEVIELLTSSLLGVAGEGESYDDLEEIIDEYNLVKVIAPFTIYP